MDDHNCHHVFPPLIGSPDGQFRVQIIGNSGSGKTTVGQELSKILGVPSVSLDEIFWKPNWVQTPAEEFRDTVRATLDGHTQGWIVEGGYLRHLGNLITEKATDVIWLDPPLALYLPRLLWRTILRLLGIRPSCSKGCRDSIRETFFSRDSIILWCLTQHSKVRAHGKGMMELYGVGVGRYREQWKMRRIGGWGGGLSEWLQSVRAMVAGKWS
ncbi:hypothetical protein AMATHDRAFT_63110 [Amanita thiersii Skay4041]|uniref:Adenylate kinase n=1 Tax=Amanita thiersii Skay4041 TaxID=703135 RepID=A0A2A9NES4_9AGAR|nr:hypothetical protein AMATHDRAFT_63110 [Amanita thiersii Skay4041]